MSKTVSKSTSKPAKKTTPSPQDRAIDLFQKALLKGDWRSFIDNGVEGVGVCDLAYDTKLNHQCEVLDEILTKIRKHAKTDPFAKAAQENIDGIGGYFDAWSLPNQAAHNIFNTLVSLFLSLKPTITLDMGRLAGSKGGAE